MSRFSDDVGDLLDTDPLALADRLVAAERDRADLRSVLRLLRLNDGPSGVWIEFPGLGVDAVEVEDPAHIAAVREAFR